MEWIARAPHPLELPPRLISPGSLPLSLASFPSPFQANHNDSSTHSRDSERPAHRNRCLLYTSPSPRDS